MFRRRKTKLTPEGPVVYDRNGRPVGVRSSAPTETEEPESVRRARTLDGLRKTRELEGQYNLRCAVSLFCSDPPRGMGSR